MNTEEREQWIEKAVSELVEVFAVHPEGAGPRRIRKILGDLTAHFPEQSEMRPPVVTICGSMRFKDAMLAAYQQETMIGKIVLIPGCTGPGGCNGHSDEEKRMLDELHLRRIDISTEVLVIDLGGYVGESTANEIAYARSRRIPVRFISEEIARKL